MKRAIRISEAEWDVMDAVWEQNPIAATAILLALKDKRKWTLATVRTLLRRLVDKDALEQEREGKRFLYAPRVTRDECVRAESDSFLDRVLGKAPVSALLHLVEQAELSTEDIQELQRVLRNKEKKQ